MFAISYRGFPGKPLQPNLIFASKARDSSSEAPFSCSTLKALDLAGKV